MSLGLTARLEKVHILLGKCMEVPRYRFDSLSTLCLVFAWFVRLPAGVDSESFSLPLFLLLVSLSIQYHTCLLCSFVDTLCLVISDTSPPAHLPTGDLDQFNSILRQTTEISDSAYNHAVLPSKTTMSKVTDHLHISGYEFASSLSELQQHGITHILNTPYEYENTFPDEFIYMHIPAKDTITERLGPWFYDISVFDAEAKKKQRDNTCSLPTRRFKKLYCSSSVSHHQ